MFTGVYKFTADWCDPCKAIKIDLPQAVTEVLGDVKLLREIDVDEEPSQEFITRYNVTAMPTMVFVINGVEQKNLRVEGANMTAVVDSLRQFSAMDLNQNSLPTSEEAIIQCQPNSRRKRPD